MHYRKWQNTASSSGAINGKSKYARPGTRLLYVVYSQCWTHHHWPPHKLELFKHILPWEIPVAYTYLGVILGGDYSSHGTESVLKKALKRPTKLYPIVNLSSVKWRLTLALDKLFILSIFKNATPVWGLRPVAIPKSAVNECLYGHPPLRHKDCKCP
jgi:hypothetical protein